MENGKAVVKEIPKPTIKEKGDVIVKMKACGLCGTDIEKYVGNIRLHNLYLVMNLLV